MDQIVPHVCALLLWDKNVTVTSILPFECEVSSVIYELSELNNPRVKTALCQNDNVYLLLFQDSFFLRNVFFFCLNHFKYSARPGYTIFISVMLYSIHHAWGIKSSPFGNDKMKSMWNQTKCWDNAIGSIGKCNSFWCYWCSADQGMSTYLENLQMLENLTRNLNWMCKMKSCLQLYAEQQKRGSYLTRKCHLSASVLEKNDTKAYHHLEAMVKLAFLIFRVLFSNLNKIFQIII